MLWQFDARSAPGTPWLDETPIRGELFGLERLEDHARSLARVQSVGGRPPRVLPLNRRLKDNASVLLAAYRFNGTALLKQQAVPPAAQWLLDNYHLVEKQLAQIASDLPPGYYRQLPKLAVGPFAGYPRVLELAWAYVAHTDSLVSGPVLGRFVQAYQTVQPLTIGELWAVAITLRIVLIENMRRLAVQINEAHRLRLDADRLVDAAAGSLLPAEVSGLCSGDLPEIFAAQIGKRLRGSDPTETPLLGWLETRLARQGTGLDDVVDRAQARQGASNVTMRNLVTSMRTLSELDWAVFFEEISRVDARLGAESEFAAMDFATRDSYRAAIETLARGSSASELEVTRAALDQAAEGLTARMRDPGHALVGAGRAALEARIGYRAPWRSRTLRQIGRVGLGGYGAAIGLTSAALLAASGWALAVLGLHAVALVPLGLLALLPATDAATALVNLVVTRGVAPAPLPGLDLALGVPERLRTLVAVPVLLTGPQDLAEHLERLEVHHLSSVGGAVHYALLSDGPDAATETTPADAALISAAGAGIARLNALYPSSHGDRFLLLHRRRCWNASEGCWMGWERKRGKLDELNRLLRGADDTSFLPATVPQDVQFVLTLDADTRLPRDTVSRLIGKLAHPLNRPHLDPERQRVTEGYGVLQPRVTAALPVGHEGSPFQRISSSPGGIEPYASAVSDVYQDLFGEGSFTGKGIYDVDAFAAALHGRVPENAMLSHDLYEGIFARAALVSDVEVIEDFPGRYDVAARRQHRWVRGDWQLWPWVFGGRRHALTPLGRWKIADNLRRSVVAPSAAAAIAVAWLLPLPQAAMATGVVLVFLTLGRVLSLPFAILPGRAGITSRSHFAALALDASAALRQIGLEIAFLPDTGWRMLDAIGRTVWRLAVSKRRLLEWVTAAQSAGRTRPGVAGSYRVMAGGVALGLLVAAPALMNPAVLPLALPFALLWLAAPALAERISRPGTVSRARVTPQDAMALRLIARRTWRYFEVFVTGAGNHLPPDNYQETPLPVVAHRTSPTNIGLYLLSTVAARDMGWIGQGAALRRLEDTLATMQRMQRHRGHFYNWYDTTDLRVLPPAYVSSVDSGNLAGHLLAVSRSCRDWQAPVTPECLRAGLDDVLALLRVAGGEGDTVLADLLERMRQAATEALPGLAEEALAPPFDAETDVGVWMTALRDRLAEHRADAGVDYTDRLRAVGRIARDMALAMDFAFLLDPDKKLLSIGFSTESNSLDLNCYDLLASEARLASLFAIAKGDVETRHWFRLGRGAMPVHAGSALISWSGSMFEYLMPSLVMRAPQGSLLEQTNRLIVARQRDHGRQSGIPWGVSESSYNARDLEMTYQYSNFGVPGLGLKRGLSENRVIAPYATGLAAMVDPAAAVRNYEALRTLGAEGRFGFYEAVDFTASRLREGETAAIVRSFMAHHQGMTITAISNVVQDGLLRNRFHAEPLVQAVDLLLQERVPRDVNVAAPRAEEVLVAAEENIVTPTVRRFDLAGAEPPTAHLLSNGSYGVMLTPTGAGQSQWRGLAVTRWRADATRDALGSFIYARDVARGGLWSAGAMPVQGQGASSAVFSEHQATFTHREGSLTTTTEVVVSAEDDAEARRVTLSNSGRQPREIDLTSYAELVLAPADSDLAHPAFSKLFVVTDHLPELGVIIATRRRRSPDEPEIWAAHIAVVEGIETAPLQIETDRARFIGRGRTPGDAAMSAAPLSGAIGTVLDPIFALRRRVLVPAGGVARVTFWTMLADSSDKLLDLVDHHRDASAFERAVTLAWTKAQVQLRHLDVTSAEAADFQRLAGFILRGDGRLRVSRSRIAAGAGPQSGLWQHGISGDLPIVVLQIEDIEDMDQVRQLLAAHEYWRARQLSVDLVILNDRAASYVQDLQIAIETAVRSSQSRPRTDAGIGQGAVHGLRADRITTEARALLLSVARVVLVARRGSIGQQIEALPQVSLPLPAVVAPPSMADPGPFADGLEFFNGTGGFGEDGREYVTVLRDGATTPAPWLNVIANPAFGFQVSAEGSGHTWAENSRENQLTPWSNDPVCDPAGEAVYLRDLDSGVVWTPTALPIRSAGTYIASHGFGYSRFAHQANGIEAEMVQFVPMDDPVKITRLRLTNCSARTRRLSVTAYAEWVLGAARSATAAYLVTQAEGGSLFASNPWSSAFPGRVAFADMGVGVAGWTGDRTSFLGPNGSMAAPAGLAHPLSGRVGAGLDPCAALQRELRLAPGESAEVVMLLGQAADMATARALIARYRRLDPEAVLNQVTGHWTGLLTAVQVKTPDRAMDILLNGWLMYQTLACRIWARAGFYQASGAYGFRDQLQDGMALTFSRPEMTRDHLLRAAARQFPEGDVQHWWLPHSGQGVRTRISDDRVWLGYGVARYVEVSGDAAVLDEQIPFLEGPQLPPGVHDAFFLPQQSGQSASLFEHCARGLDQATVLTGANGMPLIGTGDWNDGMNRVGEGGAGTSVWLGWLLIATLDMMAPLAESRDPDRAARWRAHAAGLRIAIETEGWDGEWYRRGTFDDGCLLGSASSEECRIDSIAQSWAVLSGAADPDRATRAMASLDAHLIRRDPGLALLFTPPFDQTPLDPGYIKGYPPGLRENGGQYSHAAMWAILAHAKLGDGDRAQALFALLNPINHALTAEDASRYKVEPYVVAADVYSTPAHEGRGGWTWYTGSAGWMYRAGIEGILGVERRGDSLRLSPCLPSAWQGAEVALALGEARFEILMERRGETATGEPRGLLDGRPLRTDGNAVIVPIRPGAHRIGIAVT
ncbi:cyclic beta-1,2-glucan synthetase [Cereibacter changlensis]|uniref:Cyclic beta-1,2-glucan synthetase n=1 Tax=Cereibacter changlensis TaxID=402884 RepID=A0A2W7QRW7_9RHOB|nr:cyclic beta-1,2-glucan synthetase [Cereibacter changlensis]